MRYGCVSPTPDMETPDVEDSRRSPSESSDASFEIVSSVLKNDCEGQSFFFKPCVKFHDIFDVYPMDTDVVARISHGDDFEMSDDDQVIVVPIAWTSIDQAVCSSKLSGCYVKFDVADLPKSPADQYYQLCYCATKNKNVVGVSAPFFFREVHEEELMEFQKEQNKEFWTFRSRFAVLTDMFWNSVDKNIESSRRKDSPKSCDKDTVTEPVNEESSQESDSNTKNENSFQHQTVSVATEQQLSNNEDFDDSYKAPESVIDKMASCSLAESNDAIPEEPLPNLPLEMLILENKVGGEELKRMDKQMLIELLRQSIARYEKKYVDDQCQLRRELEEKENDILRLRNDLIAFKKQENAVDEMRQLRCLLTERDTDILRLRNELLAFKKQENNVATKLASELGKWRAEYETVGAECQGLKEAQQKYSAKIVAQFKEIADLKEEYAAYKKGMERRLKSCAKEYVKLHKLIAPSANSG